MTKQTRWGLRRIAGLALPALMVGALAACDLDEFLDVEDPQVASPGSVQDPSALPVVFAGAVRDFTYAYSGTGSIGGGGANDSQILLSGLLTDELQHSGTFPTRQEVDRRDIPTPSPNATSDNATILDAYHNLHRARRSAELAEDLYTAADAPASGQRSILSSLAGFSYILFGEIYCEGVPYSSIALDGTVTHGEASTRSETFSNAIAAFDRAIQIAGAAGDANAENLAKIGKARALLNQGDASAAAALVASVPDNFEFKLEHSANSGGENNGIFAYTYNSGRYGVADNEGGNGLVWTADPRTPVVVDARDPFDTSLPLPSYIMQAKYSERNSPVVLADGREARLIQAEAAIGTPAFIDFINEARAIDNLPAIADPGTQAAQIELLFKERGHALWLTAHRLGDLRRMIRDYNYDSEAVFPSGQFFRDNLQYGTDVNFPIYNSENNNPNFKGCLNRNA